MRTNPKILNNKKEIWDQGKDPLSRKFSPASQLGTHNPERKKNPKNVHAKELINILLNIGICGHGL